MTNWMEKMREIGEAEKQKVANLQSQVAIKQQQKQLELQKDTELRDIAKRQEEEKKLKLFGVLDSLQVKKILEDIKHQIWQDRGNVIEDKTDENRFIRLSFDYRTITPEIETKEWDVVVGKGSEHVEFFGWGEYNITEHRSKTKTVKEYKVIKPSYLEVGVDYQASTMPTLYILDSEVELSTYDNPTFSDLAKKSGGVAMGKSREIQYADVDGNIFKKEPRPKDIGGLGWLTGRDVNTSYSLAQSHYAHSVEVILPSEPDIKALENFINYGLALSCSLRTSQGKLPFQLK